MKLKALRFWKRRIIKKLIGYPIPWPDEGWNLVEVTKILLLIISNFGKKGWKTSRVGSEFSFAANMFYQLNSAHRIVYDNGVDLINSGTLDTKPRKWVEFEITIKTFSVFADLIIILYFILVV